MKDNENIKDIKKRELIRIYLINVDNSDFCEDLIYDFCNALPTELKERCKRANSESLIKERILAYTALMYGLYDIGEDPDECQVLFAEYGKPYLADGKYEISLAHSGGACAAAIIDSKRRIGIDLQQTSEEREGVAKRLCSRFFPSLYIDPFELGDYISEGEDDGDTALLRIALYDIKISDGDKPYLYKSKRRCYSGILGSHSQKWACAEALLKMDGRGFTGLSDIDSIANSAILYSTTVKSKNESLTLRLSLAVEL